MLKRIIVFLLLNVTCMALCFGQQITRVAIVDLPRVYTAFFRDSAAVRQFEEESARVQREVDRQTREIQDLRTRHAEAIARDNQSEVLRLEGQINTRSEQLRTYYQTNMTNLERRRANLMQSSAFLNQVQDEIRFVAESEGFSVVFDIKNTPGIVWNSPTIDITDRLIQSLLTRRN
ncbi:MAG: OmpH family outer membrane protein [Treponema sp.]|nr:OmpH family outer membrane protein [Treponema sp.]